MDSQQQEVTTVEIPPPEPAAEEKPPKIRVQRWPDTYTLMGAPILIKDLEEAAEYLAASHWMRTWIEMKIREALLAGEMFTFSKRALMDEGGVWKGRPDGVVAEWRVATQEEVLNYVDTAQYAEMSGRSISRRAQEKGYLLHYHEGGELIEKYDKLPRQARAVLDILNEAGRENFTEASIELLVNEKVDRLKTKQTAQLIFGFYRKRLIDEGHLEEVD